MNKFEFSNSVIDNSNPIFSGSVFYNIYKDAEFLRHSDNIETILSKSHELRQMLKQVKPGEVVSINGVWLERNTPLLVKKTGPNVTIENFEFTSNRLSGLVAAYAFDNRLRFPILKSSEALSLGLIWNNEDMEKSKLFLSAVSGTEHFYVQFQFWPLVCALRKLQLKKMTVEPVVKIARVKNPAGVRMAKELITNLDTVNKLWLTFPGTSKSDLKMLLTNLPPELKKILFSAH